MNMRSGLLVNTLSHLRFGRAPLMIWGLGYIGLTTAEAYLRAGFQIIGIDTSPRRCEEISKGPVILNHETQTTLDVSSAVATGQLRLFTEISDFDTPVPCHFICIPTERSGKPFKGALIECLELISKRTPDAPIIIESTLSPRWITETPLRTRNFVLAPRRDWFHSPSHTLKLLRRVVGATNQDLLQFATDLLAIVSDEIVASQDVLAVATTKAFENSIWYLLFSYVGGIAISHTEVDFGEVLRLTRTNWRTPFEFKPAFQVGGYCLPLSYAYLTEILDSNSLDFLRVAAAANARMIDVLVDYLRERGIRSVLVLGLTYRPGMKITTNSSGTRFIDACKQEGLNVRVHDPILSAAEMAEVTQEDPCEMPQEIDCCESIVVCTDHAYYTQMNASSQLADSRNLREILDSCGALSRYRQQFAEKGINYRQLGTRSW